MATREKLRLASVRSLLVWLQFTIEKYFQSCQVAHWCRICLPIQKAQELGVRPLGREDPPEEEMATHSSISSLGNLMGRGTWWDHKQLDTTECTHAHTCFHKCYLIYFPKQSCSIHRGLRPTRKPREVT